MSSVLSSRYWTCNSCFKQFDWNADKNSYLYPGNHDERKCLELSTSINKNKKKD